MDDSAQQSPNFIQRSLPQFVVFLSVALVSAYIGFRSRESLPFFSPLAPNSSPLKPRIYDPYSFESLKKRSYKGDTIKLERTLGQHDTYTSYLFSFFSDGKKISGLANIPTATLSAAGFPVIVQVRGYVDREIYQTGVGTAPSGAVYAENGFITLAPDFLGYGESDETAKDSLLDRFENPIIVLNLLASIHTLPQADPNHIFFWGHSNGGQIALSVLEISGQAIPTTLWAPVTKPFPYSILYFTDESSDGGKYLRKIIADFERENYDVSKYSIGSYFSDITAPIQLHQGTADDAVPISWSDQFVQTLKKIDKDITYYTYEGADHNLRSGWDTVVARDIAFFRDHLK